MKPLTRGRIAAIEGSFGVGDLEDVMGQNTLNGRPSSALNVVDRGTLPSGQRWAAGKVAKREEDRTEVPVIDNDGVIDLTHEDRVDESYSAWALVPGEFAIAWGEWAFRHLKFNFPIWDFQEQLIGLNSMYREGSFNDVSTVGFRGRLVNTGAEKGTVHGNRVPSDEAIGEDLTDDSLLNEIRYKHHWEGQLVNAYISASGYVEVYNPSDMTTEQFLAYVRDEVIPYTEDADETLGGDDGD